MSGDIPSTLDDIQDIQFIIDGRIAHLDSLRQLSSSDQITQYEMRTVETRLIKLFEMLLKRKKGMNSKQHDLKQYPDFKQWLHFVDIHQEAADLLNNRLQNLSSLLEMSEPEIRTTMKICGCEEREITRLLDHVKSLKKVYRGSYSPNQSTLADVISQGEAPASLEPTLAVDGNMVGGDVNERSRSNSPASSSGGAEQKRPSIDSLNSDYSETHSSVPITPPPDNPVFQLPSTTIICTPPHTPTSKHRRGKGTPPPNKKLNNLPLPSGQQSSWPSLDPHHGQGPIHGDSATLSRMGQPVSRDHVLRRHSDDHGSSTLSSPSRSIMGNSMGTLTDIESKTNRLPLLPRSPRTKQRSNMLHAIKHRFSKKAMMTQTCDYCHDKIVLQGFKCKDCKYVCHNSCKFQAEKVPSCGLPRKYEEVFKETIGNCLASSPIMPHKPAHPHSKWNTFPSSLISQFLEARHEVPIAVASSTGDSSSNPSSTTSSTPSSPAPFTTPSSSSITPPSPAHPSPSPSRGMTASVPLFKFPPEVCDDFLDNNENVRSTSSDRTITIDSNDLHNPFTDSERTLPEQVEPVDEVDSSLVATRKNSQKLLSEWDIPFEELEVLDQIGTGRFGVVYKGKWHGDVAIKMMDIDTNDEEQLHAFKQEVSIFKKTRHEFVVLFMGACMRPPRLAIVTSLCKGQTLYTHIHLRKDRFNINRTIQIATQIAQGMGYLHHKGVVHKDLKSKNIFIENGKVVITDFALFSLGRLSKQKTRKESLVIPEGWLCYLAPELITALRINTDGNPEMELPFSEKSDVYAFGTVWYELLAGEWPFHKQSVQTVIWQVGKGLKQPLCHLQASRDVKDILMMCWSYAADSRPTFQQIKKTILRLPKKKGLHRSPSHPLHLSRSAESVL